MLEEKKQAIASYKLAKDLLVSFPFDDPSKLKNISLKLNNCGAANDTLEDVVDNIESIERMIMEKKRMPPKLYKGNNPLIPACSSSAIKLSDVTGKGRGFVANEDLNPGS